MSPRFIYSYIFSFLVYLRFSLFFFVSCFDSKSCSTASSFCHFLSLQKPNEESHPSPTNLDLNKLKFWWGQQRILTDLVRASSRYHYTTTDLLFYLFGFRCFVTYVKIINRFTSLVKSPHPYKVSEYSMSTVKRWLWSRFVVVHL